MTENWEWYKLSFQQVFRSLRHGTNGASPNVLSNVLGHTGPPVVIVDERKGLDGSGWDND